MINVKLKYLSDKISRPEYATRGSIGMDLSAAVNNAFVLRSGERALISTGIAVQIPKGYGGIICSRGGLAAKKGIVLCNGAGIIDSDYTGEVKVLLQNTSMEDYTIKPGDRIAQLIFIPVEYANLVIVDELDETMRGEKGFGSTGK